MHGGKKYRTLAVVAALAALVTLVACRPQPPPGTTTTTSTTMGHTHGNEPYISPDDPRLTPEQQARAKDLIARTKVGMARFTNEFSLLMAGYTSIRDSDSGVEHFIKWPLLQDGKILDENAIEAVVMETKPGQPKRIIAAMYFLELGSTMADVPDIAGPLTPWHNHKDLCWDPTGKYIQGVFRKTTSIPNGACIPFGTLRELEPMIHVFVTPNVCGPFAEIDDTNGIIDQYLRATGQIPPKVPNTGCSHVHNSDPRS